MNAGRDVERLIAGWLADEAQVRAPDRVLESARRSIDRTKQRRLAVAWREPMFISPARLAAMAAVVVVALTGAAWAGRVTAPSGFGGQTLPTPTPAATAEPVTLVSYRAARDAICNRYVPEADALKAQLDRLYDPALTAAERAPKVAALTQISTEVTAFVGELAALDVPPALATDHAQNLARYLDIKSLIDQEVPLLQAGKFASAEALDLATGPIAGEIGRFESKYGLVDCP